MERIVRHPRRKENPKYQGRHGQFILSSASWPIRASTTTYGHSRSILDDQQERPEQWKHNNGEVSVSKNNVARKTGGDQQSQEDERQPGI
jgi:hypothetical protein